MRQDKPLAVQAVLFDMDGVLIDSEVPAFGRLEHTLAAMGIQLPLQALLDQYTGMQSRAIYADIIQRFGLELSVETFSAEHRRLSGRYYLDGELVVMPGLRIFLDRLFERGVGMALVSSTSSCNVLAVLNRLSLLRYFGAVVCGDHVQHTKPDPEGYLAASSFLGIAPDGCLIVEDSPIGIQAARNAGIRVAGYKASGHRQDTSAADVEVDSFEALAAWMHDKELL